MADEYTIARRRSMVKEAKLHQRDAADERQYMMNEEYEVYEKQGAPTGAMAFHYHSFYEIIYVLEGEYHCLLENQSYHMKKGDFLLINSNVMHRYDWKESGEKLSSKRINSLDHAQNAGGAFRWKDGSGSLFPEKGHLRLSFPGLLRRTA